MFIQYRKTDEDGRAVRSVEVLDYSGRCETPFELPLRQHLLWRTARYADLHGEWPDGETMFPKGTVLKNGVESGEAAVLDVQLERVRLQCGKCHVCANQRKRRWERAATAWIENSPLTLFSTLTFSDEYFSSSYNEQVDRSFSNARDYLKNSPGFDPSVHALEQFEARADRYDFENAEHEAFMRQRLCDERQKMLKRLRVTLERDARFEGVKLKAHLCVYEYGDLRSRLHMHVLMHFDIGALPLGSAYSRLRKFLKKNWDEHGIGFTDVQSTTPEQGVGAAAYMLQYLLKYQEIEQQKRVTKSRSRLAVSLGYRQLGTDMYFAARPPIAPGASLRVVDPLPLEAAEGFPDSRGEADREDSELSEASKKLTLAEVSPELREVALEIARARLAFSDGELWSGWSAGLGRPESSWADVPDEEWNFASWLLSRKWAGSQFWAPSVALDEVQCDGGSDPPADLEVVPAVAVEVLGPLTSETAMRSRGLGARTARTRYGRFEQRPVEWGDLFVKNDKQASRPSPDLFDPVTGEVLEDLGPPF